MLSLPTIRIRGRTFMALVVAPEPPMAAWFTALDEQLQRAAGFFADRPIVANLATAWAGDVSLVEVLDALEQRDLRVVGVEGVDAAKLAGTRWERLPNLMQRLDERRETTARVLEVPDDPPPASASASAPSPPAASATASMLIDRPVRSGQSIIFEEGDVTIIGAVASGAEVIAGGSIHIYGALRGRAIAGLRTGAAARIFCRKLAAELVAIDGLYDTAEHWASELKDRPVQIQMAGGALKLTELD